MGVYKIWPPMTPTSLFQKSFLAIDCEITVTDLFFFRINYGEKYRSDTDFSVFELDR